MSERFPETCPAYVIVEVMFATKSPCPEPEVTNPPAPGWEPGEFNETAYCALPLRSRMPSGASVRLPVC